MDTTRQTLLELHNLADWPKKPSTVAVKLRETLPTEINAHIDRYTSRGRKPIAMARSDGVCGGCHLRVSSALLTDVLHGEANQFCDNCGRILIAHPNAVSSADKQVSVASN